MNKKSLLLMTLFGSMAVGIPQTMVAQTTSIPASASTKVYNFDPFSDNNFLKLFYNAHKAGKKFPTMAEFEAAGFSKHDLEFVRSHVRPRAIIEPKAEDLLVKGLYPTRKLWMNIPSGDGKGLGGYPSANFNDDVFSMWNYTAKFGNWNHGLFQGPGAWADAAHKNGTDIYSGIKFFDHGTGSAAENFFSFIIEKENGKYKYIDPLLNILLYFGTDGINYNWESTYRYADQEIVQFHKQLYKRAEELGFRNFHIGMYTNTSRLTDANVDHLYGTRGSKTADTFLNYEGDDFTSSPGRSVLVAERNFGTAEGVYAGAWIVHMNRSWENFAGEGYGDTSPEEKEASKRMNMVLWGEHSNSRLWSNNTGTDAFDAQENYQSLLERVFSGGKRNPSNRPMGGGEYSWGSQGSNPAMYNFPGLATYIPERSAIQGKLPFRTHFSLGNGDRYNYKGKKTFTSWYNMSAQDVVPTYRWLVYQTGTTQIATDLQPSFTHRDSYMGGSSLRLKGTPNNTDVVLYRTNLVVGTNPYLKVALKWAEGKAGATASNLYVILQKEGSTDWIEVPAGETADKQWKENDVQITGLNAGDVITHVGLRVKGDGSAYDLYVGKLEINDDTQVAPASIKENSLLAEVKEETTQSMAVKLSWAVEGEGKDRKEFGMAYNDELNIDHFEVVYKNGENGTPHVIATTSSWAAFIGDMIFENDAEKPFFGVRAVSTDLKTYSPIQWLGVERTAGVPAYSDKSYGKSQINPASEGLQKAVEQRYITTFTTTGAIQDLDYTNGQPQPNNTQYVDATTTHRPLIVRQGQEIELFFKAADFGRASAASDDGLRYCFGKAYLDLDESRTFSPGTLTEGGENIFDLGTARKGTNNFQEPGIKQKITIPANARVGKSRLRVVFSDAWFPHPGPVGLTAKGFSIDFAVEIQGDESKGRPKQVDLHDQGEADAPEAQATGIAHTTVAKASTAVVGKNEISLTNVEKAWI
ncbi:MAG: endo-beta-N-acetylglucosaminidase, partial [Bacteroidales bacterium]|nr:endo-beta-N-acetylglucosaminidase [Bacteroidales bacterium]